MLYIVSTPIGNLEDITLRALAVLRKVDVVFAEDTRKTKILLSHYKIKKPLVSFHDHNKRARTSQALSALKDDKEIALVSEAGTPGICDPGYYLIRACLEHHLTFTAIPGPTAAINALILSGMPTDAFYFAGFLAAKGSKRKKQLQALSSVSSTLVLFESRHRILSSVADIKECFANKRIAIVREMTKLYESVVRAETNTMSAEIKNKPLKGEFAVVIDNR